MEKMTVWYWVLFYTQHTNFSSVMELKTSFQRSTRYMKNDHIHECTLHTHTNILGKSPIFLPNRHF